MLKAIVRTTIGAAAVMAVSCAGAETLEATYTDSAYSATWLQESDPTPVAYADGIGTQIAISNPTGNLGIGSSLNYWSEGYGGGFATISGPQAYMGPESAPVFSVGSIKGLGASSDGVLTFTAVPEPSTWSMLLAGFVTVGALYLGRRERRAF